MCALCEKEINIEREDVKEFVHCAMCEGHQDYHVGCLRQKKKDCKHKERNKTIKDDFGVYVK